MTESLSYRSSLVWTGQVLKQWGRWTRTHWRMTLVLSLAAFVVGWVWNTYVMAVDLGGSVVDPGTDTAATAEGHTGNVLFWLLLFSLVAGLISYWWSRGWRNMGSDLLTLPRHFADAITSGPAAAVAMLLWGTGVSLVISTVVSSAVSMALGLVLLTLAATPAAVVLNFALIRIWRGLCGIVTPNVGTRLGGMLSPFMVTLGEALGLFVAWMVSGWVFGLITGIVCVVASLLLVRAAPPRIASLLLITVGAVLAIQAWRTGQAFADDGGWSECTAPDGSPCTGLSGIFDWLSSPGANVVIQRGAIGGIGAGLGALLGAGLGAGAAGLAAAAAQSRVVERSGTAQSGTAQSGTAQSGTAQSGTAQSGTAQSSTGTSQHGQGPYADSSMGQHASAGSAGVGSSQATATGDTMSGSTIPQQPSAPDVLSHAHPAAHPGQDAIRVDADVQQGGALPSVGHTDASGLPPSEPPGAPTATGGHGAEYLAIQDLLPEQPDRDEHEDGDSGETTSNPPPTPR